MFREAILHAEHPCWAHVPFDDAWADAENWSVMGFEGVPVEVDWLVRRDGLAIGAPRVGVPAFECGCCIVRVHVNVQRLTDDASTWELPESLVRTVGAALGAANLSAYVQAPWLFPDFDAPALAVDDVVVAGACRKGPGGTPLPPLSYEDTMRAAVVHVARLLCAIYPAPEVHDGESRGVADQVQPPARPPEGSA